MAMKPIKALISFEQARKLILDATRPIERVEEVSILEAGGRVIAQRVVAEMDVPPFPRAAMDGYAVRAEDTFGATSLHPVELSLVGALHAGEEGQQKLMKGTCIQIATGAPIPEGTNAVIKVEDTELHGDRVRIYKSVPPMANLAPKGEDIRKGTVMLESGSYLGPSRIGVLAALGISCLQVYARPRVAVIPSGDEVVEPGRPLGPGRIYDINSYTLASLVQENGGTPRVFPVLPDNLREMKEIIRKALAFDLVVISGGSSVGERDLLVAVLGEMGEVVFHGIAVKPGKPTLLARVEGKPVLGMPGYPTSCLTNGYGLLVPMLRRMARLPDREARLLQVPLARRVTSTIGRHQFLPVKLVGREAVPVFKESGAITSMADADGYIEIPANVDLLEKGDMVEVVLF